MIVNLEYETANSLKAYYCQSKHVVVGSECVIPDTKEDAGRVASLRNEILLKSKEISGKRVAVTGEVNFSMLYITEGENKVSWVNSTNEFAIEYELPEEGNAAQVELICEGCECSLLNPRKISVSAGICAQLTVYKTAKENISCNEIQVKGLHLLKKEGEMVNCAAVTEKTFVISEQRKLDEEITRIISHNETFIIGEKQVIGSKVIIKGIAKTEICCENSSGCPVSNTYDIPFSQIIETGEENVWDYSATVLPNSVYAEIAETINNEHIVGIEIHALTQLCVYRKQHFSYVSDAYSNLNDIECTYTGESVRTESQISKYYANGRGAFKLEPEFDGIIDTHFEVSSVNIQEKNIKFSVCADIIYKTSSAGFSCVRRYMEAQAEVSEDDRIGKYEIKNIDMNISGNELVYDISIEAECIYEKISEIRKLNSVDIAESAKDFSGIPSLFLIRTENESIWEIAKKYHSTVERIEALNGDRIEQKGKLLMVPKAI